MLKNILLLMLGTWTVSKIFSGNKRFIDNRSNYFVFFKPEQTNGKYLNNGAYPIKPLTKRYVEIDGIATCLHNDKVYKLTNGISAIVNKDGSVTPVFDNATTKEKIAFFVLGGWKNKSFFGDDHSWDNLFKAAQII